MLFWGSTEKLMSFNELSWAKVLTKSPEFHQYYGQTEPQAEPQAEPCYKERGILSFKECETGGGCGKDV